MYTLVQNAERKSPEHSSDPSPDDGTTDGSHVSNTMNSRLSHWADKYLSIIGLIVTTATISSLLGLAVTGWKSPVSWAIYVRENPAEVAIIVQVVAQILGLIQIQTTFATIRCSFVNSINAKPFTLEGLQWIQAATTPKLSFKLPWFLTASLVLPVAFSLFPAAIWSGAITPLQTVRNATQTLQVATYQSSDISTMFEQPASMAASGALTSLQVTDYGVFTFHLASAKVPIINAAMSASTAPLHAKLDKTGYMYAGRSYGAGSAVGLVNEEYNNNSLWYAYTETGFAAEVTCIRNESMAFWIHSCEAGRVFTCQFSGVAPEGTILMGDFLTGWEDVDMFAWGVVYLGNTRSIYLAAKALANPAVNDGWGFSDFNAMQCSIDFTAQQFEVRVDNVGKNITVTPKSAVEVAWPDYADAVLSMLSTWIAGVSTTDGARGGSMLGRALRINVNQLMGRVNNNDEATLFRGMEDFIASLVDDSMIALAGARVVFKDATEPVTTLVGFEGVQLGSYRFTIIMFTFNCLLCVIYVAEAVRTKFWRKMSPFDLMDLSSIIIGSLKGGITFAGASTHILTQHTRRDENASEDPGKEGLIKENIKLNICERDCEYPAITVVAATGSDIGRRPVRAPSELEGSVARHLLNLGGQTAEHRKL